jgi:hypothetical protein
MKLKKAVYALAAFVLIAVAVTLIASPAKAQRIFGDAYVLYGKMLAFEASEGAGVDVGIKRQAAGVVDVVDGTTLTRPTAEARFQCYDIGPSATGAKVQYCSASELLTLSTGGTTTDTTANLLPANSFLDAVTGRVTTTITAGCTGWQLGDPTTAGRFTASNVTLAAGTVDTGKVYATTGIASATTGMWQASAAKVRVTCATAAPGAGAVRIEVFYHTVTPSTS